MGTEKPFDSRVVANEFLRRAELQAQNLTNMQVVKLTYFAHGFHLARFDDAPLLVEPIEAWQHGPVVPSVYHAFKQCGRDPIPTHSRAFTVARNDGKLRFFAPYLPEHATRQRAVLDDVWDRYKSYSGWELREMTHAANTPWTTIQQESQSLYGSLVPGLIIPNSLIADHYRERLAAVEPGCG